ncbi:glycosyltransferase family 2 protein [Polychaeton citri CBS 116435]|uniref:chitin synthase n=1 Tax=Polychaeton citri CBS 116435 TaxID=1314669 RepID=A0A9P4QCV5_9PEZI|nr:glycosyltransferase family 2 protein [Polychaeton citri CBS 116435]
MANRFSSYSTGSNLGQNNGRSNTMQGQGNVVSTTSLLNQLHTAWQSGQPYPLESSTSLVVNTWKTAENGGTVDVELGRKAWEHARRRAEDGCILLGSLHRSTPSLLTPFVSALPLSLPQALYTSLDVLRPFLHTATPFNPSFPRHSALAAAFTLNLGGELTGASLALSTSGIDIKNGLLDVPAERGYRAFDVFYYLLCSTSQAEREFLYLMKPSQYGLLRKSETYGTPSYLPTADDNASAEDWRENLKAIGIKDQSFKSLLAVLSALLRLGDATSFLVDGEELEAVCEEVADLLEMDSQTLMGKVSTDEREVLIGGLYEALVDWVISKANEAIRQQIAAIKASSGSGVGNIQASNADLDDGDTVSITVVEVPGQILGKAASLKTVFDDANGINAEMKDDGVPVVPAGSSVMREMKDSVAQIEADLDITGGPLGRERDFELDRRQGVLEKVGSEEKSALLDNMLYPVKGDGIILGTQRAGRFSLSGVLGSSRVWFQLCLHPSDESPSSFTNQSSFPWSAGAVSSQIRAWRLPEWANHRNKHLDFTADFEVQEFVDRYFRLGCQPEKDGVETWLMQRGWSNGEVIIGKERIWMREAAWWEAESMLDMKSAEEGTAASMLGGGAHESGYAVQNPGDGYYANNYTENPFASRENLAISRAPSAMAPSRLGARSLAPTQAQTVRTVSGGDYGLGRKGDDKHGDITYEGELDPELAEGKRIEEQPVTLSRRVWVFCAYAVTWWIPSFLLKHVGRMKRPDVRLAWREKILLILIIFFLNAIVVFWIVEFGNLLCPNWNKAWNAKEIGYHQGDNDYWVSFRGGAYDLSDFWKLQHSDTTVETTKENMQPFGGTDVSSYIVPPLNLACPGLVAKTDTQLALTPNNTLLYPTAEHKSGTFYQPDPNTKLRNSRWYADDFLPRMKEYYKGELVIETSKVKNDGENNGHQWFIIDKVVYDLTDYFSTLKLMNNLDSYNFLPEDVTQLVQQFPGQDITKQWAEKIPDNYNKTNTMNCFNNMFKVATTDFRKSARCQVNNYLLLAFAIIVCAVILVKFLAALQLGSKRRPAQQDKFVICQVPAYTEGEDQLRKGLDSLTALAYDNKRKLICVICDGMIVGGGNDRPTPKIVLDILGVDPKIDPPALPFKSVGQGSEQLNYGKVYSGLYEYEGNVVPYLVVVKVGKNSEQSKSKPGNRGKRDSQILLMSFLNRVHHRAPMSPLELEMFHQINNIIGVDPELYEYLFMVDADTKVKEDSLNRLVAACANDAKIAGICGETSLENEEGSWWTMIQVYEYYISHHLAKAFESLFGSVTCLPGCFSMYRLRTADKGRPIIISDKVISEYADINVDTLHKKNLLSLGEDRYLTTLMTKHFPSMSYKFIPDAYALTEAPAEWSVLLSQRRRWINSTIHNLAELVFLKDLCGFCCFSMRFVVFIDLFGTIILPATCCYLIYLIYRVASGEGAFPMISIVMIAAVYGLQAIIFIIKRQWQHIGWMIIYLLAYPIYSVILPIYSFWKQDDFSWGNTRIVIGEKGMKKVVAQEDEGFDPRSIPLQRWDEYALANNLPGRRGAVYEKESYGYQDHTGFEMDEMQSVYSSVKPASTILTGFPQQQMYRAPQSPSPYNALQSRNSTFSRYTDNPNMMQQQHHQAMDQQGRMMSMQSGSRHQPQDNLLTGMQSPPIYSQHPSQSNLGGAHSQHPGFSRAPSAMSLPGFQSTGPSNDAILHAVRECLGEVDLDSVTKKQLKSLAEMKLQVQLQGPHKVFLDQAIDDELARM